MASEVLLSLGVAGSLDSKWRRMEEEGKGDHERTGNVGGGGSRRLARWESVGG